MDDNQKTIDGKTKSHGNLVVGIILAFLISIVLTFFKTKDVLSKNKQPIEAYQVYLKGESIGLIKSDQELYDYINHMQKELMDKYNVDNVYIPNDIHVSKDVTYIEKITSVDKIYNIMNEKEPFTIKGYKVTIDKTSETEYENEYEKTKEDKEKKVYINILDKEIFKNAAKKVVLSFVSEDDFFIGFSESLSYPYIFIITYSA